MLPNDSKKVCLGKDVLALENYLLKRWIPAKIVLCSLKEVIQDIVSIQGTSRLRKLPELLPAITF